MSSIRPIEMKLVDQLFERPNDRGYVLDFSNNTFSSFFAQELGTDIYQDRYSTRGSSKLNRLRCYLEVVPDATAAATLGALWEYRETLDKSFKAEIPNAEKRLNDLIIRLSGKPIAASATAAPSSAKPQAADSAKVEKLRNDLIALTGLAPHPRGLAFERFLKDLFDAYGMEGHGSIKLRGE